MLRRNLTLLNFYQYGELIHRGIVCVPIYLASMSNPVNRVSCEPRHMGDSHTFLSAWENYYQHFQKITITNIILSENYCRTSLCLRLRRNLSPKLFAYISSEHVIDIPFRFRYNDLCCCSLVYILRIQVWAWLQRFLILYIRRHDWQQRSIYISCTRNCTYKNSYMSPILLIWTCICNSRNWWHIVFEIKTSHNYRVLCNYSSFKCVYVYLHKTNYMYFFSSIYVLVFSSLMFISNLQPIKSTVLPYQQSQRLFSCFPFSVGPWILTA